MFCRIATLIVAGLMLAVTPVFAADRPSQVKIDQAISQHIIINGMTLREANRSVAPTKPKIVRTGGSVAGRISGAIWKQLKNPNDVVKRGDRAKHRWIIWTADLDEDQLLTNVGKSEITE